MAGSDKSSIYSTVPRIGIVGYWWKNYWRNQHIFLQIIFYTFSSTQLVSLESIGSTQLAGLRGLCGIQRHCTSRCIVTVALSWFLERRILRRNDSVLRRFRFPEFSESVVIQNFWKWSNQNFLSFFLLKTFFALKSNYFFQTGWIRISKVFTKLGLML